ncbi:tyrosine-type recombinase/integrase [Paenibacillus sp. QZ-Y1]|uniref:tyrosine-type recombinase/integrase n=1 Tax=Paenibacillus sp. QZ-Y1 TaxID=3414511 RepID=UPI003F78FDAB
MSAVQNVTGLHRGSIDEDIKTFIGKFQSKHTRKSYERSIRNFFMWYRNKDIEQLTIEDIKIRNTDIVKYQTYLKKHEADYANVTVNNYIEAIQSLYEFFEINEYPVKSKHLKIDILSNDSEHAGALYLHEAEQMAELVLRDRKQGQEKSAFLRMAYTTSFRKGTLQNLKWTDIKPNISGNYYEVSVVGKGGKKHVVPISTDLYDELLKIREFAYYQKYEDGRIFHLTDKTIRLMLESLKQKLGILPERNVVFHSFRNVAAGFGTLEEAKRHLNHSNISTTETYYRHINEDLSNSISLRIEDKIDDSILEKLTKEEMIEIIMNQDYGTLSQIKREAQEIVQNKGEMSS